MQTEMPDNPHNRSMFPHLAPLGSMQAPAWATNGTTQAFPNPRDAVEQQQQHDYSAAQQQQQQQQQSSAAAASVLPPPTSFYAHNPYSAGYITQTPAVYQQTSAFPNYAHATSFDAATNGASQNGFAFEYTTSAPHSDNISSASSIAVTNPFAQHNRSASNNGSTNGSQLAFTASTYPSQQLHQMRYASASPTPGQLSNSQMMHYTFPQQHQQQQQQHNAASAAAAAAAAAAATSAIYQGRVGGMPPHHIGLGPPSHTIPPHKMSSYSYRLPLQDRPFKCDQCVQSFNRNHDLKRHKRIHLAVKPFPCHHCDKSFSRKDALKRHILVKGCGAGDNPQKAASVSPSASGRSLPGPSSSGSMSEPNSATFPPQHSISHPFGGPTSAGLLGVFNPSDSDAHSV